MEDAEALDMLVADVIDKSDPCLFKLFKLPYPESVCYNTCLYRTP